ncbi:hypothetical protein [Anaerosolibacter sp.]|uniref:hypothetical protein n=1 Tax=Anaerosolibacter sp. TaxID=1872527 RepID=UPI0039EE549E
MGDDTFFIEHGGKGGHITRPTSKTMEQKTTFQWVPAPFCQIFFIVEMQFYNIVLTKEPGAYDIILNNYDGQKEIWVI